MQHAGTTEESKRKAELLKLENEILNSGTHFYCEKLSARISRDHCRRNFKKAMAFNELEYLKKQNNRPQWGNYGNQGFVHPNVKKCQGCEIGENNAKS